MILDPFTTLAVIQSIENDRPFNWAAMEILEKNVNLGELDRALVENGEVAHLLNLDPVLLGGNYEELLQSRAARISDFFNQHQIIARIHAELARQGYKRRTRAPHFYIVPEWVEYARGWTDISVKVLSQNQQLKDVKININRSQGEDPAELLVRETAGYILNINRASTALPLLPE